MEPLPDFNITSLGPVSREFIKHRQLTFQQAARFICHLPYRRNADKHNLLTVFSDGHGTCSTKHALLKHLADENNFTELQLILGLFKMNGINTPSTAKTLTRYHLDYVPEAHNYLKFNGRVLDVTKASPFQFEADLIEEHEISPEQITQYKVAYHKQYLENWLATHPHIAYTLPQLWEIREQCIKDLGD